MAEKKKENKDPKQEFVSRAINDGINAILKDHPIFSSNREYIAKRIDMQRLNSRINEIYDEINEKHRLWGDKKKLEYMHNAIADYVASSNAFDDRGQVTIFRKGIEEKAGSGFFRGLFARRELKGERVLEKKLVAYHNLYDVVEKSGLSEDVPEVYQALRKMRVLGGTVIPAIESMRYDGIISEKKYQAYKRNIKENVARSEPIIHRGIEQYINPQTQKAAAVVLGAFGLIMFALSSVNFTGRVISNPANSGGSFIGLIGLFSFVAALFLFLIGFNPDRKSSKKKAVRKNKFKN